MSFNIKYAWKIILSIGISLFIVSILFRLVNSGGEKISFFQLVNVLKHLSFPFIALYFLCTVAQGLFRALRYQLILKASREKNLPGFFHVFIVTLARNMFVDFLPARAGELTFIALMTKGYKVSGKGCVASLGISIWFDFLAVFFILLMVFVFYIITANFQGYFLYVLIVLGVFILLSGWILLYGLKRTADLFFTEGMLNIKILKKICDFIMALKDTVEEVRKTGIFFSVFMLSLSTKIIKYIGGYFTFLAVVLYNYENFKEIAFYKILYALLCAEGAVSLPVPSFMSFGTYEIGGMFVFTKLGFSAGAATLTLFAMHMISQIIDYVLGGIALIVFFLLYGKNETPSGKPSIKYQNYFISLISLGILATGIIYSVFQMNKMKKTGTLKWPEKGGDVEQSSYDKSRLTSVTKNISGLIAWSSNRFGNHDILLLSLPDFHLSRLTENPHTETYPRISPDGRKIVFCRSQLEWVSQRDSIPWDIYIADTTTKKEVLAAKNGFAPSWSAEGDKIYFQRNNSEFIEQDLKTNKETILFKSGTSILKEGAFLENPHYNPKTKELAVTLRGSMRNMGILSEKSFTGLCDGCQLTWSGDFQFLYYTYYGGKGRNAFYKYSPLDKQSVIWFDSPSDYSHEYFPKISGNGKYLVYGASTEGHEHDTADYEIFFHVIDSPASEALRITYHTGNDCWPDIYIKEVGR